MALLSSVDESTFLELSKRFHQKLKQQHVLSMPLSKFRELMVQSVGHKSLHDARKSWLAQSQSTPASAISVPPHKATIEEQMAQAEQLRQDMVAIAKYGKGPEELHQHSRYEEEDIYLDPVSQALQTDDWEDDEDAGWITLPEPGPWDFLPAPWQAAIDAIKEGRILELAQKHPLLIESLNWEIFDEKNRYRRPMTFPDYLISKGPTEWEAYVSLAKAGHFLPTPLHLRWMCQFFLEHPVENIQAAQELLEWTNHFLREHDCMGLESVVFTHLIDDINVVTDSQHLEIFKGVLAAAIKHHPNHELVQKISAQAWPQLITPGMAQSSWEIAWKNQVSLAKIMAGPINEALIQSTLLEGKATIIIDALKGHPHAVASWAVMKAVIPQAIAAGIDHRPFLQALALPEEGDYLNRHFTRGARVGHAIPKLAQSIASTLLKFDLIEDLDQFFEKYHRHLTPFPHYLPWLPLGQEGLSMALKKTPASPKDQQLIWKWVLPDGNWDLPNDEQKQSLEKTHEVLVDLFEEGFFTDNHETQSIFKNPPSQSMVDMLRTLKQRGVDFESAPKNRFGLSKVGLFELILWKTRFSIPWLKALHEVGIDWKNAFMSVYTLGEKVKVEPLVAGLLDGAIPLEQSLERYSKIGLPELATTPGLETVIKHVFSGRDGLATREQFIQAHRLHEFPSMVFEAWKYQSNAKEAKEFHELTKTFPEPIHVSWWIYRNGRNPNDPPENNVQRVLELLDLAVEWGVDLKTPLNPENETHLHWACTIPCQPNLWSDPALPLLKRLVQLGVDPTAVTTEGKKARQWGLPKDQCALKRYHSRIAYLQTAEMEWAMKPSTP